MVDLKFRSALLNKDTTICYDIISSQLKGENLVSVIYELLHASALVKYEEDIMIHPICVINSLKNFIGDDKEFPSESVLNFAVDYLVRFKFRNFEKSELQEINNMAKTIFMGDFEDACQNGNWEEAKLLLKDIYIASDNSRAALDILAELALQDGPRNAIFVYHILRAFQFQQIKNDNWTFIDCIFNIMKTYSLKNVHPSVNINPKSIKSKVINMGDITYFSALERIWDGEYTRIKGYRREISYWISKIKFYEYSITIIKDHFLNTINKNSFISFAEKIIKNKKTKKQKAEDLVTLDAIRHLSRNLNDKELAIIGSRYNDIIL